MKIEKTAAAIKKAIKSVVTRSGTLQNDIQDVAVACVAHYKEHGDWTLAFELNEGISKTKGAKHAKLRAYLESVMCGTFSEEGGKARFAHVDDATRDDVNVEMAEAVKWYDFKPAPKDNSKTLEELIAAFGKNLTKSVEAGKTNQATANAVLEAITATLDVTNVKAVIKKAA